MELLTTHAHTHTHTDEKEEVWKEGRGRKWLVLTGKLVKEIVVCGLVCVYSPAVKVNVQYLSFYFQCVLT